MFQSVIEAVAHHGENTPEKLCVVDETKALTYGEFWVGINEVTEKLKKLGINKEDKVTVECTQNAEFLICGLACHLMGAVFVPLEKNVAKERAAEIIEVTEAKCFICRGDYEVPVTCVKEKEFFESCSATPEKRIELSLIHI